MEKMDLETFRRIKAEILGYIKEMDEMTERGEQPSEDYIQNSTARITELYNDLFNHDLSEIDFEEWRGFYFYVSDEMHIDMSKTNANLDFSIIEYVDSGRGMPDFRGCSVRNFDFSNRYFPEMFDEYFISEHQEHFLDESVPEEIRLQYYRRELSIEQFSEYLDLFKGKRVGNHLVTSEDSPDQKDFINAYGDDIVELFERYKPMLDILIKNHRLGLPSQQDISWKNNRDAALREVVISYFSFPGWGQNQSPISQVNNIETLRMISDFVDLKDLLWEGTSKDIFTNHTIDELIGYGITDLSELTQPVLDLHRTKEIMEKLPEDLVYLGGETKKKIDFIKKYGIDYLIRLDEESNGMFSHNIGGNNNYLDLFALVDELDTEYEVPEEFTYEDFKNRMYEILKRSRHKGGMLTYGDYPNYDFIQGEFRKEHSDIFLEGEFDNSIIDSFYMGRLTAENIRTNPHLANALLGKDLIGAFEKFEILVENRANVTLQDEENGDKLNRVNGVEYLTKKFGQEEFLRLCMDYGECLDSITIRIDEEDEIETVRDKIEIQIYKAICENGIKYFDELPDSFKQKHPEMFLPDDFPEELKEKFYAGTLSFDDIRNHPEIKKVLLQKDAKIGFRCSHYVLGIYGEMKCIKSPIWDYFSESQLLDLASAYGSYLDLIEDSTLSSEDSFEEKIAKIESLIEKSILTRNATYGEKVPEFFKQKYPELFLDEEAPEDLKVLFDEELYRKRVSENRTSFDIWDLSSYVPYQGIGAKTDGKLSFELIKEHPEWKKYLEGKDLRLAFPKQFDPLFEIYDSETILKIGLRNPDSVNYMVKTGKTDLLVKWYKATGERFIPHYTVMMNFPEDEIDSFLANGRKWSRLSQFDRFSGNNEGKVAVLKMAYAMGVFHGSDDGFQFTMDMLSGIPNDLETEELQKAISILDEDDTRRSLLEDSYQLGPDGKYILRFNPQSDKKKTKIIREILEQADVSKVLTLEKAHQLFGGFAMEYDPDFVQFFKDNVEQILSDSEHISDIAQIQRRFSEIKTFNASIKGGLTYEVALNYIRETPYHRVEVGNEELAKLVSQSGYSQEDFEELQRLFDEGETREFSSIPRIIGERGGYTYEMLRLDDPLTLLIGKLTDCCQELHESQSGETSMTHSMLSRDGRVMVVRDEQGRIVAQSWVWRNGSVICYDNIEIPKARFEDYRRNHPEEGKSGLAKQVLEVYKQATRDIMRKDESFYKEMLEKGEISQEEFDSLVVSKVTVGLGWNDTAEAIKADSELIRDDVRNLTLPEESERIPYLYTDAKYDPDDPKHYEGQWIIGQNRETRRTESEAIRRYEDEIPIYGINNINSRIVFMIHRMAKHKERTDFDIGDVGNEERERESLMRDIGYVYGFRPEETMIMATHRMALVYSQSNGTVKIGELFTVPIKEDIDEQKKAELKAHIKYQLKKAMKQLMESGNNIDLSELNDEDKQIIQLVIQELEEEKKNQHDNEGERGE